jgi:hypothetical protein
MTTHTRAGQEWNGRRADGALDPYRARQREPTQNPASMMATGALSPYREVTTGERNPLKYGEIPHLDQNFGVARRFGL